MSPISRGSIPRLSRVTDTLIKLLLLLLLLYNFFTLNWCSELLGPFDYILASYSKLTKKRHYWQKFNWCLKLSFKIQAFADPCIAREKEIFRARVTRKCQVNKCVKSVRMWKVCKMYRAFSHDVTAAILVFQNNETAAMLVFQTNRLGVELFS